MENLEELFAAEKVKLGETPAKPFTTRQTEQAVDILDYTWKPVHEMLDYILKTSDNEMQVQQTLHNIQSLINMAGSVGLSVALESVVASLCNWQLPSDLGSHIMCKKHRIDENTWEVGYKHVYVCNAIFNVAQCLHKILDRKAWAHLFDALQKIAVCIRRVEGDMASQDPQPLHFNTVGKRVAENMARYLPKGVTPEQMRTIPDLRVSELSAGTGEGKLEDAKAHGEDPGQNEDPSSPFRTSSISEEEDKDTHIQQIHRFDIKTATTPMSGHKRTDNETGPGPTGMKLVPPGKFAKGAV